MKNVYPDVLKYTPKENADLIEKISKRGLWIDQNVLFWLIFMLEDSQYGFFQFLPDSLSLLLSFLGVIWSFYVLFLIFYRSESFFHYGAFSYVNYNQEKELFILAKGNPTISKYLFLLRVSGRKPYVLEYNQLKESK